MLAEQRYKEILRLMEEDGTVKSSSIKTVLNVSGETIRRDLEKMESLGLIRRMYGGAVRVEQNADNTTYTSFQKRNEENIGQKHEVAELAAHYIQNGQAIALDSGTTSLALARVIKRDFQQLTVVTNSLAIANELADAQHITLILTGGMYRPDEDAFTTEFATLLFAKLNVDIFFLTTCGISVEKGVTYQRMDEILVQNKMMESAARTIVITDSTKLGNNSLVRMCGIDRISMIITDSNATAEQLQPFQSIGMPIVLPHNEEGK